MDHINGKLCSCRRRKRSDGRMWTEHDKSEHGNSSEHRKSELATFSELGNSSELASSSAYGNSSERGNSTEHGNSSELGKSQHDMSEQSKVLNLQLLILKNTRHSSLARESSACCYMHCSIVTCDIYRALRQHFTV